MNSALSDPPTKVAAIDRREKIAAKSNELKRFKGTHNAPGRFRETALATSTERSLKITMTSMPKATSAKYAEIDESPTPTSKACPPNFV